MPEAQKVTTLVTVAGIMPGTPPVLAWSKRLQGAGGREKIHTQWVKILDPAIFERLQQVHVGDEIMATVVTDWHEGGYMTYLADFSSPVPQSPDAETLTPASPPSPIVGRS
jgi:hypothetical protein